MADMDKDLKEMRSEWARKGSQTKATQMIEEGVVKPASTKTVAETAAGPSKLIGEGFKMGRMTPVVAAQSEGEIAAQGMAAGAKAAGIVLQTTQQLGAAEDKKAAKNEALLKDTATSTYQNIVNGIYSNPDPDTGQESTILTFLGGEAVDLKGKSREELLELGKQYVLELDYSDYDDRTRANLEKHRSGLYNLSVTEARQIITEGRADTSHDLAKEERRDRDVHENTMAGIQQVLEVAGIDPGVQLHNFQNVYSVQLDKIGELQEKNVGFVDWPQELKTIYVEDVKLTQASVTQTTKQLGDSVVTDVVGQVENLSNLFAMASVHQVSPEELTSAVGALPPPAQEAWEDLVGNVNPKNARAFVETVIPTEGVDPFMRKNIVNRVLANMTKPGGVNETIRAARYKNRVDAMAATAANANNPIEQRLAASLSLPNSRGREPAVLDEAISADLKNVASVQDAMGRYTGFYDMLVSDEENMDASQVRAKLSTHPAFAEHFEKVIEENKDTGESITTIRVREGHEQAVKKAVFKLYSETPEFKSLVSRGVEQSRNDANRLKEQGIGPWHTDKNKSEGVQAQEDWYITSISEQFGIPKNDVRSFIMSIPEKSGFIPPSITEKYGTMAERYPDEAYQLGLALLDPAAFNTPYWSRHLTEGQLRKLTLATEDEQLTWMQTYWVEDAKGNQIQHTDQGKLSAVEWASRRLYPNWLGLRGEEPLYQVIERSPWDKNFHHFYDMSINENEQEPLNAAYNEDDNGYIIEQVVNIAGGLVQTSSDQDTASTGTPNDKLLLRRTTHDDSLATALDRKFDDDPTGKINPGSTTDSQLSKSYRTWAVQERLNEFLAEHPEHNPLTNNNLSEEEQDKIMEALLKQAGEGVNEQFALELEKDKTHTIPKIDTPMFSEGEEDDPATTVIEPTVPSSLDKYVKYMTTGETDQEKINLMEHHIRQWHGIKADSEEIPKATYDVMIGATATPESPDGVVPPGSILAQMHEPAIEPFSDFRIDRTSFELTTETVDGETRIARGEDGKLTQENSNLVWNHLHYLQTLRTSYRNKTMDDAGMNNAIKMMGAIASQTALDFDHIADAIKLGNFGQNPEDMQAMWRLKTYGAFFKSSLTDDNGMVDFSRFDENPRLWGTEDGLKMTMAFLAMTVEGIPVTVARDVTALFAQVPNIWLIPLIGSTLDEPWTEGQAQMGGGTGLTFGARPRDTAKVFEGTSAQHLQQKYNRLTQVTPSLDRMGAFLGTQLRTLIGVSETELTDADMAKMLISHFVIPTALQLRHHTAEERAEFNANTPPEVEYNYWHNMLMPDGKIKNLNQFTDREKIAFALRMNGFTQGIPGTTSGSDRGLSAMMVDNAMDALDDPKNAEMRKMLFRGANTPMEKLTRAIMWYKGIRGADPTEFYRVSGKQRLAQVGTTSTSFGSITNLDINGNPTGDVKQLNIDSPVLRPINYVVTDDGRTFGGKALPISFGQHQFDGDYFQKNAGSEEIALAEIWVTQRFTDKHAISILGAEHGAEFMSWMKQGQFFRPTPSDYVANEAGMPLTGGPALVNMARFMIDKGVDAEKWTQVLGKLTEFASDGTMDWANMTDSAGNNLFRLNYKRVEQGLMPTIMIGNFDTGIEIDDTHFRLAGDEYDSYVDADNKVTFSGQAGDGFGAGEYGWAHGIITEGANEFPHKSDLMDEAGAMEAAGRLENAYYVRVLFGGMDGIPLPSGQQNTVDHSKSIEPPTVPVATPTEDVPEDITTPSRAQSPREIHGIPHDTNNDGVVDRDESPYNSTGGLKEDWYRDSEDGILKRKPPMDEEEAVNRAADPQQVSRGGAAGGTMGLIATTVATSAMGALPADSETYTMKKGDTLYGLAKKNDTTVEKLKELNKIPDVKDISIGTVINLPPKGVFTKAERLVVIEKLKGLEGFEETPRIAFDDEVSRTVGYGHLLDSSKDSRANFKKAFPKKKYDEYAKGVGTLTKEEATRLLDVDLVNKHKKAKTLTGGATWNKLSPTLRQQLVYATYRSSWGGSKEARKKLRAGEYAAAAKEFVNSDEYRNAVKNGQAGLIARMNAVKKALEDEAAYQKKKGGSK